MPSLPANEPMVFELYKTFPSSSPFFRAPSGCAPPPFSSPAPPPHPPTFPFFFLSKHRCRGLAPERPAPVQTWALPSGRRPNPTGPANFCCAIPEETDQNRPGGPGPLPPPLGAGPPADRSFSMGFRDCLGRAALLGDGEIVLSSSGPAAPANGPNGPERLKKKNKRIGSPFQ